MDDAMIDRRRQAELVGWLREHLTSGRSPALEITHSSDTSSLPDPDAIDGRVPDLLGRADGKLCIGLARMGAAVGSEQSIDDYEFFGNYREPGAEEDAAFILGVPGDRKDEAEAALARASLRAEQFHLVAVDGFAD